MCDIYDHKCSGCGAGLPIHIGDFCIPRNTLEVRCEKCPPSKRQKGWVLFTNCIDTFDGIAPFEHPYHLGNIYIRYLGPKDGLEKAFIHSTKKWEENGFLAKYGIMYKENPYFIGCQISPNCQYEESKHYPSGELVKWQRNAR